MRKILSLLMISAVCFTAIAQEGKRITLEDIYKKGTFRAKSVYGLRSMNDGEHYTVVDRGTTIKMFDYATGKKEFTIMGAEILKKANLRYFADYSFSSDESKILISTDVKPIYRRSYTAEYYVYYRSTRELKKLSDNGAQMAATFSPDGKKVAFVRENNVFVKNLESGKETKVTTDGKFNHIINGACDWVYEEEFGFAKAFCWSPEGDNIAFYRFDESRVKEFEMMEYKGALYPKAYRFKYPKAGEDNSIVSIHVYNLASGKTTEMNIGDETNQYISRIKWSAVPGKLAMIRQNRLQNNVEILLADAATGESKILYNETNKRYITEVTDNYVTFLPENKQFIITSEQDGWNHIYLYGADGKKIRQLTKGEWDVTDFIGYDPAKKQVYYECARISPMTRDIYRVRLNGKRDTRLTKKQGKNSAVFSKGFKYYINYHSTLNSPNYISLFNKKGAEIRVLEDNSVLKAKLAKYPNLKREFISIVTEDGIDLNAWILKPHDFDASKQYPVLMTQYSGPNSQQVLDRFEYGWYHYLAQEGYIVVCVDPRGTGARGEEFRKMTYGQLGKYEVQDQIAAARYLSNLKYVDGSRIGIWGWSYGGFMSSACLFKGNDIFKAAIAVAPVINWRYYDSVYTERYMGLPQDNASGYDDNSPINLVDGFKSGKYLLIHGTGDDNVHVQNAWTLVEKLVQKNKQFEMQFYPDRNHGIYGGNTRIHLYKRMSDFVFNNL